MKYKSVFEIIGPIMIGPSSSHTAGAVKIGNFARSLFNQTIEKAEVIFYGSFAKTHKGHGTDIAIVGGILGFRTDDERMEDSIKIAQNENIEILFSESYEDTEHPNTARVILSNSKNQADVEIVGVSIGGGNIKIIEINGFKINLYGEYTTLLVENYDKFGAIANVTNILAQNRINIAHMEVSRHNKGENALMVIEIDGNISDMVIYEIKNSNNIKKTIAIK